MLRGQFAKPTTLSPRWLAERDLIGHSDLEEAKIHVLVPEDLTIFDAPWFRCHVQSEFIQLVSAEEPFERLRDLAAGILKSFSDAKLALLGINRSVHFPTPNLNAYHAIGDRLVQNDAWGDLLDLTGMRSVTQWGRRPDGYGGRIEVKVEPSQVYPLAVFVAINDHFDLTFDDARPTTRQEAAKVSKPDNLDVTEEKVNVAIQVLQDEWSKSTRRAQDIIRHAIQLTREKS